MTFAPRLTVDDEGPARPTPRGFAGIWLTSCILHGLLLTGLSFWPVARPIGGSRDGASALELIFRGDGSGDGVGAGRGPGESDVDDVLLVSSTVASEAPDEPDEVVDGNPAPDESEDGDPWEVDDTPLSEPAPAPISREIRPGRAVARNAAPDSTRRPTATHDQTGRRRGVRRAAGRTGGGAGGTEGTSFFEVQGRGTKFVYVIDRSVSMAHKERFGAAREELLASLAELPETALVQVVFYNEEIDCLPSAGKAGLVRNTALQQNKLAQFASGIVPDGGTRHLRALLAALEMAPDAIFLLTDADEPRLDAADLDRLRRANRRGVAIHAIELGVGPRLEADNFLMRLARQSRGGYRYWDIEQIESPAGTGAEVEIDELEPSGRIGSAEPSRRRR